MKNLVEKFSNISEKERKIYQSVLLLLQEGRDMNALTVSEITERAGIGKGTAYGYFKSKEEMVENAVLYGIFQCVSVIGEKVEKKNTFREKYLEILDWMDTIFFEQNVSVILYQLTHNTMNVSCPIKKNFLSDENGKKFLDEKMNLMVETGIAEGTLRADCAREYQQYMIMSSIGAFWMFLNQEKNEEKENRDRFKAYLYRCLVNNLNQ